MKNFLWPPENWDAQTFYFGFLASIYSFSLGWFWCVVELVESGYELVVGYVEVEVAVEEDIVDVFLMDFEGDPVVGFGIL